MHIDLNNMGGRLTGHSLKNGAFYTQERFDFDINVKKGGSNLHLVFEADKQYVNGMQMPFPRMVKSSIDYKQWLVDIHINSNDLGPKLFGAMIHTFLDLFLAIMKPLVDGVGFPMLANIEIGNIINESKGQMSMGPLQILLSMLPDNDIKLGENVAIDYANMHGSDPFIRNKRAGGYFEGKVKGLGSDAITDERYNKMGDLNLDDNGAPYQF